MPANQRRAARREANPRAALLASFNPANRRACQLVAMSDKVALSDVMLFIMNHARFEPANRRKRPPKALRTARGPVIGAAAGCRSAPSPARSPRAARRDRPRLRPRRDVAKHQPRLRRRLAPLCGLGAAAEPPRPAPGSASSRPLHRRLRLRRGRPEAVLGQHHRAAPLGAHVEFRPARPADGPQGPARRHRSRRDPPHPRPPA